MRVAMRLWVPIRNTLLRLLAGRSPIVLNVTIEGRLVLPEGATYGYVKIPYCEGLVIS